MTELFTFESLSVLAEPSPEALKESDPRWMLEASRREAALLATQDETDLNWLLKAAQFAQETAQYERSQGYLRRVLAACPPDRERTLARALLLQGMNYVALLDGESADRSETRLEKLAQGSGDQYLTAVLSLAKGLNLQYSPVYIELRKSAKGATLARPFFEDAIAGLLEVGETDLAIRAYLEYARTRFELGSFFSGIDALENATKLARESESWGQINRIILLFASNASDMGYRAGVESVIRLALAWSNFLGDRWGRVDALTVLGQFLYYSMPPGRPELVAGPDQYLQAAIEEAEALGLSRFKATVDSARFFLYRKAGDDKKLQLLLGDDLEEEEFRKKQAQDNRREIEQIAEQRRRTTSTRLHDGVEDSQDAFFVFNAYRDSQEVCRDFCWVYMNRAANKICDRSGAQVYLFSEAERLPEFEGLSTAMLEAVDQGQSYQDIHWSDSGGIETWLQRRVVPSGPGVVVTFRDVTAEKRIETALREAADSARRSENAKSAFLASMSHEIRTPLNGVLGLTRMLAETDLNSAQRAYVENIIRSGDVLLDLLGEVLDLSKIEAGEMHLAASPVFLPSHVSSVVNLFGGQAQERGTNLRLEIAPSVPETVLADAVRLRQILSNLVGNAVKFTEGGSVVLRVSGLSSNVVFEVQDTGIGISSDDVEAVFSRFKQAGGSARGGTGLGLAITKALAELMGGELGVVSELGHGSTFKVSLPLPGVAPQPPESAQVPDRRFDGRRILVVDDNEVNLLVSSHAIEKLGCETVCASNGREALDILARERFDLVFLDVQMPGLDGLEVTRELRRREAGGSRTLVIALTAGALLQERQACFDAGMDDFITKPITPESIRNILTKWLRPDIDPIAK